MTKPPPSAKAGPKVWKEDQISRVFKSSYDQPSSTNDNSNSWECLPKRYLSRWYLVQPQQRPLLRKDDEPTKKSATLATSSPKNRSHSEIFSRCPRVALPESGKFQRNVVLYGWLRPNNNNDDSDDHRQRPMIQVCISDLNRWVINRSKEQRGYWIFSQMGSYWLQDPCTHKVPVYSPLSVNDKRAETDSNVVDTPMTIPKKRKRGRPRKIISHGSAQKASQNNGNETAATGKENSVGNNAAKNATTQEAPTNKETARLASQEDVHLQHRLRLGLLSILLEDLASKKDDEVVQFSQFDPKKMMAYLKRQQQSQTPGKGTDNETLLNKCIFDWKLWQPHGHFLGSYLLLSHVSLSVVCPLLLGLFGKGEKCDGLNYEYETDSQTSGGRKRKASGDHNPHCTPEAMLELALQAEQKTKQTPWGLPLCAMSTPTLNQSRPGHSSSTKDTQASQQLGIKEVKRRGRGRPRKRERVGLKESSNEKNTAANKNLTTLGPLKKPRQEPASHGTKTPNATTDRGVEKSTVRPPIATPMKRTLTGILRTPIKGVPNSNVTPKRVNFHAVSAPRRQDDDDVSVGSTIDEPIVIDSDTDESDEASHQEEEDQEYPGPIFRFRRGTEVVALCVDARDLSTSMKEVVEKAIEFGESDEVGVFQWSPSDKRKLKAGKLTLLFRVGLMGFTKDHFDTLTAQDIVDIAPLPVRLPPNSIATLPVELHFQQPSRVDIEVRLNPSHS